MKRKVVLGAAVFIILVGAGIIYMVLDDDMTSSTDIERVQEQHEDRLLDLPGVIGVGISECEGEPCLKVFVTERTPALEAQIPQELDGFRVEIEVTEPFEAQPD